MRRLTALIKKIVPFPAELRDDFSKIVKVLDLLPGEWVPDDLPAGTSIFVEEGLLSLTTYNDNRWRCTNFYPEGTLAITYSEGAAEMQEGSFRVRAGETTRIYYLTREDRSRVDEIFPAYAIAYSILRSRSFAKNQQRASLFKVPPAERIMYVDIFFPSLLRAPTEDLAEFLNLENERQKTVLQTIQSIKLSPNGQLSEKHN
ncbi:MAG TPA: hypothetical protein VHW43_06275 [Puia sp.]|nr:hypothetical protein [Puia sp.]